MTKSADPFARLRGNVVVIHGWGGSRLVDARHHDRQYWPPSSANQYQVHPTLHLPITVRDNEPNRVVAAGFLDAPADSTCYYGRFLCEIRAAEKAANGRFRLHLFAYDFRRNNMTIAERFGAFLGKLYAVKKQPACVISHSMGGVITLAVMHRAPYLMHAVLMAGPPLNGSITALRTKMEGSPQNQGRQTFTPETHLLNRSSFSFFPFDGTGLVHAKDGSSLNIDYYDPEAWLRHRLSSVVDQLPQMAPKVAGQVSDYLRYAVGRAGAFRAALLFPPRFYDAPTDSCYGSVMFTYPRIVVLAGNAHPTVSSYPATLTGEHTLTVHFDKANYESGDKVVTLDSATPPYGIPHRMIFTNESHMTLLNDLSAVQQAFDLLLQP